MTTSSPAEPAPRPPAGPLYYRVVVDGVEVRATNDKVGRLPYPIKTAYPVRIAGVVRALLVFQEPGWRRHSHKGWALRSLLADSLPLAVSHQTGDKAKGWLLRQVPTFLAEGKLPTQEEADARAIVDAERQRVAAIKRAEDDAERKRKHDAMAIKIKEAHRDLIAGLREVRERGDLTNFQQAAVIEALRQLWRPGDDE